MVPKQVTNSAAIAIVACLTSAVAHATAMIASFHRSGDLWPAWVEIFAISAVVVGLGAGIFSYAHAPVKPPAWRPAKRWTVGRLAPTAAYVGALIVALTIYKSTSVRVSELIWRVVASTAAQFAFALSVWDKWWMWRQITGSNSTR
jgi:hypothetical protein